jgi:hypothetical protein
MSSLDERTLRFGASNLIQGAILFITQIRPVLGLLSKWQENRHILVFRNGLERSRDIDGGVWI